MLAAPPPQGKDTQGWLRGSTAFREAGGVAIAVALLASGPDRRIVRDALAVLVALLCGGGAAAAVPVIPRLPDHLQLAVCRVPLQSRHCLCSALVPPFVNGLRLWQRGTVTEATGCPARISAAPRTPPRAQDCFGRAAVCRAVACESPA